MQNNISQSLDELIIEKQYWINTFEDITDRCSFPFNYPNTSGKFEKESCERKMSESIESEMNKITMGSDLLNYYLFFSTLAVLTKEYTSQDDFIIGTSVFSQKEKSKLLNTILPIRCQLEQKMSFGNLIKQMQSNILEATNYYAYPVSKLVEDLEISVPKTGFPLFDIALVLDGIHDLADIEELELNLVFIFTKIDGHIIFKVKYNKYVYSNRFVNQIIDHFLCLLDQGIRNVETPIDEFEILSAKEREQIINFNSNIDNIYSNGKNILQEFSDIVLLYPNRIAIKFNNEQLSYKILDEKSNQLARHLIKKGVKKNYIVGILLNHSQDLMVSILAVLKTGSGYLPIDPSNSEQRIKTIIAESNIKFLISKSGIVEYFSYTILQNLYGEGTSPTLTAKRDPISNLDSLPIPDRSLINYSKYSKYIGQGLVKNAITMQASRGCPYSCAYCCRVWPRKAYFRSAEHIFKEVKYYYERGFRKFVIIDDIFNLDKENAIRFFDLIIENKLKIMLLFPSGLRGDILTKEFIDKMIEAGTRSFPLSLETASERLHKMIKKNLDLERFRENIEYIIDKYPHVILELNTMHGFPTETIEESQKTLNFIKSLKYIHFPYVHILKYHSNTDIEKIAMENGLSKRDIEDSKNMAYHEIPDCLPFPKSYTLKYQSDFLNNYVLLKDRLLKVLPYQLQVLNEDELVQKYNSYLPFDIYKMDDFLNYVGIKKSEIEIYQEESLLKNSIGNIPGSKISRNTEAISILLIDASQYFSDDTDGLYNVVEQPLGLLCLATYLNEKLNDQVNIKIIKSGIDFDNFNELKDLLLGFKPDVIGIRALTYYRNFFHRTVARIKNWLPEIPVIAGGPYATNDYKDLLKDPNIDFAILGEGELTFLEVIQNFIYNNKKLPDNDKLSSIPGIAFIEGNKKCSEQLSCQIIELDCVKDQLKYESTEKLNLNFGLDSIAYVIYTSGTSGVPKGTLVSHENLKRIVKSPNYCNVDPSDIVLNLSNYAFDGSMFDFFAPLLNGARLVMFDRVEAKSIIKIANEIKDSQITLFFITTALLNMIVDFNIDCIKNVRKILFGGEMVSFNHIKTLFDKLGKNRIIHMYGPTETAVFSTFYPINQINNKLSTVPIGKPVNGTNIYILNKNQKLVPIGVIGELYIGNLALSLGYLNCGELTDQKFIKILDNEIGKVYKTGDLAKFLPDGNIQIIGRKDSQIKLRGFRIELEEIKNQIFKFNNVKDVLVIYKKNDDSQGIILAYVQLNNGIFVEDLKNYLKRNLPDYMIPSFIIKMESFPMTTNGKIDFNRLPAPGLISEMELSKPENETQKRLVEIWANLINIDQSAISIDADFFDIGGHSLLALRLANTIQQTFNKKIDFSDIIKSPTIRNLSEELEKLPSELLCTIESSPVLDYYYATSIQQRLYSLQQMAPESVFYNITLAYELHGNLDIDQLKIAIKKLIKRHSIFRTSFQIIDNSICQIVSDEIDVEIQVLSCSKDNIDKMISDFNKPFDLSLAPLLRVGLVEICKNQYILAFNFHHIIIDGYCMPRFFNELVALFKNETLPDVKLHYKDYSYWLSLEQQQIMLKRQKEFWLNELSQPLPLLNLPFDFNEGDESFVGETMSFSLDKKMSLSVNKLARDNKLTLFTVLFSIFKVLLSRICNQENIIVGTTVSGRNQKDLDGIFGIFINTLPIKSCPERNKTFIQFLYEIKDITTRAFLNQNIQLEDVMNELPISSKHGGNPLFDAVFVLQNNEMAKLEQMGNLTVVPYKIKNNTTMFPINFLATEFDGEIQVNLMYAIDRFKQKSIENVCENYIYIVEQVIENNNIKIGDIDLKNKYLKSEILTIDQDFNL